MLIAYKTNLKQGAHIHQPTTWPVPHACEQPYHLGSGSHEQPLIGAHQHAIAAVPSQQFPHVLCGAVA